MELEWKENWTESRRNLSGWWNQDGLVIGMWPFPGIRGPSADPPHEPLPSPESPSRADEKFYSDAVQRARRNHYWLSRGTYPADLLPVSETSIGPGSLALYLGSEPGFAEDTVWFGPIMKDDPAPEKRPKLEFDPDNRWWKIQEATLEECAALGRGRYLVGCPDLIENLDILASLRGTAPLLMDMIERPDWVNQKLGEINRVYFEVYDRIYDIIKLDDGSAVFEAFRLWAPGKVAKVQCDSAAMLSPQMFRQFVIPHLREQCEWLDYSMYHLDGKEELHHLDALLELEALDAIEWTPNSTLPFGGDPSWYDLYRRILEAGKSVQAWLVWPHEIVPLLDAVGGKGMYILGLFTRPGEVESVLKNVEQFR